VLITAGLIAAAVILRDVVLVSFAGYVWIPGTGFNQKTLWDWLDLAFVPLSLALVAAWFTWRQNAGNQKIASENVKETEFQFYLEKLTDLILTKRLLRSRPDSEIRKLATAHTLRVFRRLDPERRKLLLRFLFEAELVLGDSPIIPLDNVDIQDVALSKTDLTRINLCYANCQGANFSNAILINSYLAGVKLEKANLSGSHLNGSLLNNAALTQAVLKEARLVDAKLICADFSGADLTGADLSGADLDRAVLKNCKVEYHQLEKAHSLFKTVLPNGDINPGQKLVQP